MKNLPLAIRFILNVIFFIIYCIIGHFLSGILFAFILTNLGKDIPNSGDPIFIKIGLATSLFILFLTLIFRKYFYISLEEKQKIKKVNFSKNTKKDGELKKGEKEDIKIYIEKELNK